MPCSNCGNCGHNVRTCSITIREKRVNKESEFIKIKKKLKMERRRSINRLREIRKLTEQLGGVCEEMGEQVTTIFQQQKQIENQDDTIQKLKKDENDICNICFDSIPPGMENKTECGHSFHCGCLLKWLKKNNSCPCCRAELYEKPEINKDLDRVVGDALVSMYGYSIIRDVEMIPLIEFGNNIISSLLPEENLNFPNVEETEGYIRDYYTDDAYSSDSSNEEDWQELVGSEHNTNRYVVNIHTGEIRDFPIIAPGIGGIIGNSPAIDV